MPGKGEFRRIRQQVVEHLPQPHGVGRNFHILIRKHQIEPYVRTHIQQIIVINIGQQPAEPAFGEIVFHRPGLDFRQIEHVRNQSQQLVAVGIDQTDEFLPLGTVDSNISVCQQI